MCQYALTACTLAFAVGGRERGRAKDGGPAHIWLAKHGLVGGTSVRVLPVLRVGAGQQGARGEQNGLNHVLAVWCTSGQV